MVSPSSGEGGAGGPRGLAAARAAAPGGAVPGSGQAGAAGRGATSQPCQSVMTPPTPDGGLEELAVCDLCGLVTRLPAPPVCPACSGGYG